MKHYTIKNESIWRFITGKEFDERVHDRTPHSLMKDEIILPKERIDIEQAFNNVVIIILSDEGREKRSKLQNTYTYQIDEYDNLSWILTLMYFKVEQSEVNY